MRAHDDARHAQCKAMIEATPALLEEAVAARQAEDRMFRQNYRPDKTPAENYEKRAMLYVSIDNFLTEHYPEHFQALYAAQNAELATLDKKIAALQQAIV